MTDEELAIVEAHMTQIKKAVGDVEVILHGSRYWLPSNHLKEDTDWDYAVNYDNVEQLNNCYKQHWTECVDRSYCDINTSVVFEKVIDGRKVQLSFRRPLSVYKEVLKSMCWDVYKDFWDKGDKQGLRDYLAKEYEKHYGQPFDEDLPF